MSLRAAVSASLMVVVCLSCRSSSSSAPSLSISPGGTVQVSGKQVFSAVARNSTEPVTWTLSGPGTLSNSTGYQTSYIAPSASAPSPGTGILTATRRGREREVCEHVRRCVAARGGCAR